MLKVIASQESRIPKGVQLLMVNDQKVEDLLEFEFYNDITKTRKILINVDGDYRNVVFKFQEKIAITFEEPRYRQCENKCDFCFINGLPKELRKELYFRDDDYRLSFLFGNFLSLTNVSSRDVARIGRLKLSPLYVSVHTTVPDLRRRLFKNSKAGLIMEQLSALIDKDIKLHCQVVLIPGITDGKCFIKTITDLSSLYPGITSIGVVPLGRSKYLKGFRSVSKQLARDTVEMVKGLHRDFRKKYKKGIIYCADEFFIKAGYPIPDTSYYDDFPQCENGIGMARVLIDEIKSLNKIRKMKGAFLILTSMLAQPFMNMLKRRLAELRGVDSENIDIVAVKNTFFGNSVTVSGLIGACDFTRTIRNCKKKYDRIILPPNCVNESGEFIDKRKINDKRVMIAPNTIKEFLRCLQ